MTGKQSSGNIAVKPYKFKEVASLYNIDRKTLRTWLKPFMDEVGPLEGHYFKITQIETIFKNLGLPYEINAEEIEEKRGIGGKRRENSGK